LIGISPITLATALNR
jgi:integrase